MRENLRPASENYRHCDWNRCLAGSLKARCRRFPRRCIPNAFFAPDRIGRQTFDSRKRAVRIAGRHLAGNRRAPVPHRSSSPLLKRLGSFQRNKAGTSSIILGATRDWFSDRLRHIAIIVAMLRRVDFSGGGQVCLARHADFLVQRVMNFMRDSAEPKQFECIVGISFGTCRVNARRRIRNRRNLRRFRQACCTHSKLLNQDRLLVVR